MHMINRKVVIMMEIILKTINYVYSANKLLSASGCFYLSSLRISAESTS